MSGSGWPITLVDADPAWRVAAWAAIGELWQILEPWRDGGVHHIGSTAIAGVPAEGVVDLLAGLADPGQAGDAQAALVAAGWRSDRVAAADASTAVGVARYGAVRGDGVEVAVELRRPGDDRWATAIWFRDRLRADERARRAYAGVKRRAATEATSRVAYDRRKAEFVQRMIARE